METVIKLILDRWYKNPETNSSQISLIEKDLGLVFSEDYKRFLIWSNGGEGGIGDNYVFLWKIENLAILNKEYQIQKYLSNKYLAIGTDGGDVCYGYCVDDNHIFKCGLGDLDIKCCYNCEFTYGFFQKSINRKSLDLQFPPHKRKS